ncbi:hypothetical protein BDN72DRAFT_956666 [Pluteus cervinus]|uniref:Uncharacterized protein n=1 Tax=Pluteus cervinus TaxID=181527 RepID=A0ACD3B5J7_9AGAR|nr:hypothetical protein BDN72DRAFT_956666 [Pluteus cervinus]
MSSYSYSYEYQAQSMAYYPSLDATQGAGYCDAPYTNEAQATSFTSGYSGATASYDLQGGDCPPYLYGPHDMASPGHAMTSYPPENYEPQPVNAFSCHPGDAFTSYTPGGYAPNAYEFGDSCISYAPTTYGKQQAAYRPLHLEHVVGYPFAGTSYFPDACKVQPVGDQAADAYDPQNVDSTSDYHSGLHSASYTTNPNPLASTADFGHHLSGTSGGMANQGHLDWRPNAEHCQPTYTVDSSWDARVPEDRQYIAAEIPQSEPQIFGTGETYGTSYQITINPPCPLATSEGHREISSQHQYAARVSDPCAYEGRSSLTGTVQAASWVQQRGPSPKYNTQKSYTNMPVYEKPPTTSSTCANTSGASNASTQANKRRNGLMSVQAISATTNALQIRTQKHTDRPETTSQLPQQFPTISWRIPNYQHTRAIPAVTPEVDQDSGLGVEVDDDDSDPVICAEGACRRRYSRKDGLKRHVLSNIECLPANWSAHRSLWWTRGRLKIPLKFSHEFTPLIQEYARTKDGTKLQEFIATKLPRSEPPYGELYIEFS